MPFYSFSSFFGADSDATRPLNVEVPPSRFFKRSLLDEVISAIVSAATFGIVRHDRDWFTSKEKRESDERVKEMAIEILKREHPDEYIQMRDEGLLPWQSKEKE